jgi:hypothetical protein
MLLRKVERQVKGIPIPESYDMYDVDQILRSSLFGLLTTFDPETESEFDRYYYILSLPESTRDDYQIELEALRQRLGQGGVIAEMARRQIVTQVIDEQLDERIPEEQKFDPQVIKEETRDLIAELWDEVYLEEGSE